MKKVLFIIDHAPNYRESFLNELGKYYKLTVVAQPCERDNLKSPPSRGNYHYIELKKVHGNKIRFNFEFADIIDSCNPDIFCVAINPRHPYRFWYFLRRPLLHKKWIWWGQVFGRSKNNLWDNVRKRLMQKAFGVLVYSDTIVNKLDGIYAKSFNNSQYSRKDFIRLDNKFHENLNCLFVGRPQPRKRLEILLKLAKERYDLHFRLVGPGMTSYFGNTDIPTNVSLFEAAEGNILRDHFEWSNIVVNPGHVGLLVMNAACHNRPIVIDSEVRHAPEKILAEEATQFFIDFENNQQVNNFFDEIIKNPTTAEMKGNLLYDCAISKYTIENMVAAHREMFDQI